MEREKERDRMWRDKGEWKNITERQMQMGREGMSAWQLWWSDRERRRDRDGWREWEDGQKKAREE